MKRSLLACLLALLLPLLALAQAPRLKTLFSYKEELGLSPQQIAAVKAQLNALGRAHQEGKARIRQLEDEYLKLLSSDAGVDEARAKLRQIADATVELRLKDFTISRAINAILTPQQRRKWQEIKQRSRSRGR